MEMQELIVFVLVTIAAILVGIRLFKSFRRIGTDDPCGGCGKSCEGCPVSPKNRTKRG
ncbi:MAG: FeoB-associated Cys-rich membrane protein [Marinilabiliales bacterium]|nr:FeoB-associated Cys-rich membrane protein [Marinilabiliales bacterium]